jgi:hypothetical protein
VFEQSERHGEDQVVVQSGGERFDDHHLGMASARLVDQGCGPYPGRAEPGTPMLDDERSDLTEQRNDRPVAHPPVTELLHRPHPYAVPDIPIADVRQPTTVSPVVADGTITDRRRQVMAITDLDLTDAQPAPPRPHLGVVGQRDLYHRTHTRPWPRPRPGHLPVSVGRSVLLGRRLDPGLPGQVAHDVEVDRESVDGPDRPGPPPSGSAAT